MKNLAVIITSLAFFTSLSACTASTESSVSSITQWDFDHQVQFNQIQLTKNTFQLEIIPNNKVKFKQLAVFLLRKSYLICGGYHYKLEMIQGIEGYDDKRAMPNYIPRSLIAKIECESKKP